MYTIIETKEMAQSLTITLLDYVKEHDYMLCKGAFDLVDKEFVQAPSYDSVILAYEEIRNFLYVTQADPMGFKVLRDEVSREDYLSVIAKIKQDWATPSGEEYLLSMATMTAATMSGQTV